MIRPSRRVVAIKDNKVLELFDDTGAPSQVQQWQSSVAAFFRDINRITSDEAKKVEDGKYATNTYLKLVK